MNTPMRKLPRARALWNLGLPKKPRVVLARDVKLCIHAIEVLRFFKRNRGSVKVCSIQLTQWMVHRGLVSPIESVQNVNGKMKTSKKQLKIQLNVTRYCEDLGLVIKMYPEISIGPKSDLYMLTEDGLETLTWFDHPETAAPYIDKVTKADL